MRVAKRVLSLHFSLNLEMMPCYLPFNLQVFWRSSLVFCMACLD